MAAGFRGLLELLGILPPLPSPPPVPACLELSDEPVASLTLTDEPVAVLTLTDERC